MAIIWAGLLDGDAPFAEFLKVEELDKKLVEKTEKSVDGWMN